MFDKAKIKALKKLVKIVYPGRDIDVEKIRKHFVLIEHTVGCNDFVLEGQYSYDQVVEFNKMTGYSAGFGFCKELGPVAFIGVPNINCVNRSGNFKYNVQAYGDSLNDEQYYFEHYDDDVAKRIGNYTVYGMGDPRVLENAAPIRKVQYFKDARYHRKDESFHKDTFKSDVLEMDIRLGGTYSFYEARKFAYGSTGKFKGASGEDVPIQFAIVGDNQPVGILDLWNHYDNAMFRDVWGANDLIEPIAQPMRFLSDEEASKINNFKLYYLLPTHSYGRKKYVVEKKDRTLEKGFNFIMEDGTDYRLQVLEKEEAKVLKKQPNNNQ